MEMSAQTVTIAITLFIAWSGFLVGVIKLLISRAFKDGERRFEDLEVEQARERTKREDLEREFREHLANLPMTYVQREDWIRLGTTIDTKLDRLWERMDKQMERHNARG